jgi:hypothetical protein
LKRPMTVTSTTHTAEDPLESCVPVTVALVDHRQRQRDQWIWFDRSASAIVPKRKRDGKWGGEWGNR